MMMRAAVIAVVLCIAGAYAQGDAAPAAPVAAAPAPAAAAPVDLAPVEPASTAQQQLLAQQMSQQLAQLATLAQAQTATLEAAQKEVSRAATADAASDAALLGAVQATQAAVAAAAAKNAEAVTALDSAQRQLIGEFKQELKGVTSAVKASEASLKALTEGQAADGKADSAVASQLQRITAALDALTEAAKKPAAPTGPSREETSAAAAAAAAQRKADGERHDALATAVRAVAGKLDALEAKLAALLATVEKNMESRSVTARVKAFAAEAKDCAVTAFHTAADFATARAHTLRPLIVDWIASLQLQNRAIAAYEWSLQTAQVLQVRAVAEGQVRVDQLAGVLQTNGFPAPHAPLMALSLVLTATLIVGLLALWLLSKTLLPVVRKLLFVVAWTVGLFALAVKSVLCCGCCRRRRAAAGTTDAAGADAAGASKKAKRNKKKAAKAASGGAVDTEEEPPSEDEVIPTPATRK